MDAIAQSFTAACCIRKFGQRLKFPQLLQQWHLQQSFYCPAPNSEKGRPLWGHLTFSLVKVNNVPAYRGNILLRLGGDSSGLTTLKTRQLKSCKAFGKSKFLRVSPLYRAKFSVSRRRIAPHRPSPCQGRGGGGGWCQNNKMIAVLRL